jgi:mono/diheme cytochrome c family protein
MTKILKWIGIILGILLILVIMLAGTMFFIGGSKLTKTYAIQPAAVEIPNDKNSIKRGAYLYAASCAGCHGDNLSGKTILDDPVIGYLPAPNLTSGQGGVNGSYSDTDFVRAIRHGVNPEGQGLLIMPSKAYWYFSGEDLEAIIAFIKTAPPVDNDPGVKALSALGKIMLAAGAFGEAISADVIDHDVPLPVAPERGATAAYGEYMVNTGDCATCHGADFAGAQSPEPGSPFSSNLTPGSILAIWAVEDFIETMRTGVTPYGRQLDSKFMPYEDYGRLTDEDLTAMFLYLQSLPALETPQNK